MDTVQGQYDSRTTHSANLYQIFTHVKNRAAGFGDVPHVVSGMLLYARTNEILQSDQSYLMSGNRIEVRTLDLNREFCQITAQLDGIASEHFMTSCHTCRMGCSVLLGAKRHLLCASMSRSPHVCLPEASV